MGATFASTIILETPAAAQDYTNVTATGSVVDASGNGISGATVTVTSNAQGFTRSATTDSSGTYRVPALPQGSYTFQISAPGFSDFSDSAVTLTQSSAGNQFQLVAAGAATSADSSAIIVTGRRVRVSDFDRTTTGAVIQIGELAARVPVARDLTSVVLLAPGTALGDSAFGNLAAISGSSVSENVFFLNGLNITEFREGLGAVNVPFEFYNTIEVKNGGIPAEFGRFTGGFVNATTKSGSNEFHGGMLMSWEPDALREDSPNTIGGTLLATGYNQADKQERLQTNIYLSGPILKDRLFFYGFYQAQDISRGDTLLTSNVAQFPAYSTGLRREERSTKSPFWGGKLDAIITDGHRLEFTYFDSSQKTIIDSFAVVDENGGSYDSRVDAAARPGAYRGTVVQRLGGENYIGRYTGQFTDWLTLSGAYGKNKNQDIAGSSNDDYPFITDVSGAFNPALSGNSLNLIDESSDTREFYRGDIDLYFTAFGQHHIKGGYDREDLTTDSNSRYTGGVAWTYNTARAGDPYAPAGTLYVSGRTHFNGGVFKSRNEAFYVQDSWSLFDNRLTFNLGVRNDRFENKNVNGETYFKSGDQWAPRLSFSVDPTGDSLTKVYGSFGRYYLPVPANTNIRLAGAELDYTRFFQVAGVNPDNTPILGAPLLFDGGRPCFDTGVANCELLSDGTATPTAATVSQSLKPQSVDEYVLGIERRLGSLIRVGLFGQYRKLNESLEDVAIDAAVNKFCAANGISGCEDTWSGFHQYVLTNPGAPARIQLSDPLPGETSVRTIDFSAEDLGYPKARRTYKAVTFTFDRDFDGVWSLSGSYTWSKSKGNIEGGIRSDNGQTDSGLTTAFDQPGLTDGTYGYLPGDNRHKFKLYGSYQPLPWLTLGANFSAQSPRRFGCIGRVPASVDAFAGLYGAAGFYCRVGADGAVVTNPRTSPLPAATLTPRGTVFKSDWQTVTNLTVAFKIPAELFSGTFRVDVFNAFNEKAKIDFEERGTTGPGAPRSDYGLPNLYQTPRYFRFQLGIDF
nr:TonB-dependent receptor [Sphingomonas oleivorans]